MKHGKSGLSLLEVMLAVLMVGISIPAILSLQGVLSRIVFTTHTFIDRIPFIHSFFVEADRDKLYEQAQSHKKEIEDPPLFLQYIAKKSTNPALGDFRQLMIERVIAQWPTSFGSRTETVARIRFVPAVEGKGKGGVQ